MSIDHNRAGGPQGLTEDLCALQGENGKNAVFVLIHAVRHHKRNRNRKTMAVPYLNHHVPACRRRPALFYHPGKIPAGVNIFNDAAARELLQDKKGPVFVATVHQTKLDDIATQTFHASPDEIARLGFAVAHILDNRVDDPKNLSQAVKDRAQQIAGALSNAKRPVVISGTSSGSDQVVKAAANISWALHANNNNAGIVFTLPECNSMGLAAMRGNTTGF